MKVKAVVIGSSHSKPGWSAWIKQHLSSYSMRARSIMALKIIATILFKFRWNTRLKVRFFHVTPFQPNFPRVCFFSPSPMLTLAFICKWVIRASNWGGSNVTLSISTNVWSIAASAVHAGFIWHLACFCYVSSTHFESSLPDLQFANCALSAIRNLKSIDF